MGELGPCLCYAPIYHIGPTQRSDREIVWSVVRVTKSCTTGKWVPYNEGIVTCVSL